MPASEPILSSRTQNGSSTIDASGSHPAHMLEGAHR